VATHRASKLIWRYIIYLDNRRGTM